MQVNIQKETNTERHTKVFKGMCYAHFVNGVHMGAISITLWGFLNDHYKAPLACSAGKLEELHLREERNN